MWRILVDCGGGAAGRWTPFRVCCSKEIAAFVTAYTPLVTVRLINLIDRPVPPDPFFGGGSGDHVESKRADLARDSNCVLPDFKNVSGLNCIL